MLVKHIVYMVNRHFCGITVMILAQNFFFNCVRTNLRCCYRASSKFQCTTPCGRYVITGDRDEKIRVSHYPKAYNIGSFCLGHSEFIAQLRVLQSNAHTLVSGSGVSRIQNFYLCLRFSAEEVWCIIYSCTFLHLLYMQNSHSNFFIPFYCTMQL